VTFEYTGESTAPEGTPYDVFHEQAWKYAFAAEYVEGRTTLDVGCAWGMGLDLFLSSGCRRALGIELSREALREAQSSFAGREFTLMQADACALPIATRSVECVVALEVLEHVLDPEGLVRECARVLQKDGVFVCSTPNLMVTGNVNPHHVREFTFQELEALLAANFAQIDFYGQRFTSSFQTLMGRLQRGTMSGVRFALDAVRLRHLAAYVRRLSHKPPRMAKASEIRAEQLDPGYRITAYSPTSASLPRYFVAVCRP